MAGKGDNGGGTFGLQGQGTKGKIESIIPRQRGSYLRAAGEKLSSNVGGKGGCPENNRAAKLKYRIRRC